MRRACVGLFTSFLASLALPAPAAHAESSSPIPAPPSASAPTTGPATAATATSGGGHGGGLAVYLFAGHSGWDTTALDGRLTALGYSTFSPDPGSGGLGLRAWVDACRCMGDLEFQFALASATADDGRQLSLTAGQLMVHAGRILYARGHLRTHAMLGVGYGSSSLTLDPGSLPPRSRNPLGFADGSAGGASNFALAVQGLVGVDYLVPFAGRSRGFNGVFLGLRAGYNAQPLVSSWSASTGSGVNATTYPVDLPRVAADGAFVHVVFGDLALAK
ncbi:MAG TPA: hypothetical protein VHS09_06990 [Polyangiaceae bacterium]|nr:hypothetical protein [Polyangiaceae bacterium]